MINVGDPATCKEASKIEVEFEYKLSYLICNVFPPPPFFAREGVAKHRTVVMLSCHPLQGNPHSCRLTTTASIAGYRDLTICSQVSKSCQNM